MKTYDFDLFVIGGGSGGVRASRIAAGHGAKVAVAEEYRVGGTCVIRGCVPKKLMMYASQFGPALQDSAGFGWCATQATHEWRDLIRATDKEVTRLEKVYETLLEKGGVEVLSGRATIVGPHEVRVNERNVTADRVLIATGATPEVPEFPGAELMVTSDDVFRMTHAPQRVAIVGGGYIACEFAGIFNGLGSNVWMVHRGSKLLRDSMKRFGSILEASLPKTALPCALPPGSRRSSDYATRFSFTSARVRFWK